MIYSTEQGSSFLVDATRETDRGQEDTNDEPFNKGLADSVRLSHIGSRQKGQRAFIRIGLAYGRVLGMPDSRYVVAWQCHGVLIFLWPDLFCTQYLCG